MISTTEDSIFEDQVLSKIHKNNSKTASKTKDLSFEDQVFKNCLSFKTLKRLDPKIAVSQEGKKSYRVKFSSAKVAFGFKNHLMFDNPQIDLTFDEDLLHFEPEEHLVKKSKNPLWVIKQLGPKDVLIKRVWS